MKKSHGIALVSVLGVLVVAIIATVLIVKHNDNQTVATGQESNISGSNSSKDSNGNKQIKLSQVLYEKKDRVWLGVNSPDNGNLTRSTVIDSIGVTNNGKFILYNVSLDSLSSDSSMKEFTLKDAAKLSDKQLVAKAKKMDKAIFTEKIAEEVKTEKNNTEQEPGGRQIYLNNLAKIKYKAPKAGTVKINAYDDGSTNNIVKEEVDTNDTTYEIGLLEGQVPIPGDGEGMSYKAVKNGTIPFDQPVYPRVVDGVIYGGTSQDFITRLKKGETIIFDSYNDKHVHDMGETDDVEYSEDDSEEY